MRSVVTLGRRSILGALVLTPLFALPRSARAQIAGGETAVVRFRAVRVDTSPVAEHGGAGIAAALRAALGPQMQKVFADRIAPADPSAAILMARISSVFLSSYVGGVGIDQFGQQDNIEGDGIVVSGGRTVSSTHVLTELSPSYSGAYYTAGIDRIRLDSLAYQFAYWLRREMNV